MKKFSEVLGKKIIINDGAFGSLLQQQVSGDFIPDELILSNPGIIEQVHIDYATAGADIISTNTFGASPLKLKEVDLEDKFEQINREAAKIALKVARDKQTWVAGDIGPCGKLLEPLGTTTFDEVKNSFAQQAKILAEEGVDLIHLETITDIQELRAAVVGILSAVSIPVIASMAFTSDDLSLSGTDGQAFAVTTDFPRLSCVGSNCGTSLANMKTVIEKIARYAHHPIICQPNAGLPEIVNGETVFNIKPDEFADFMDEIYQMGIAVMGSCCGSTPDFTNKLSEKFKNHDVLKRNVSDNLFLSSRTAIKEVSPKKIFIVGERINPTGRKKLRKELESGRLTTVRLDAKEQEKFGAHALDINVNLHKLNLDTARSIIKTVQNMVNLPLVIDSMDPVLIEEFAKLFAGKGVINSISGETESLDTLLPVAQKYNMAFIAVLMDEKGIADTAAERLDIANKIVNEAKKYDIPLRNIIFDPLVLSAGAEIEKVSVTLDTMRLLKQEYPANKIIMGLSNISFGLPNRELVNCTFLTLGAAIGLDMIIANPAHDSIRHQVMAVDFLKSGSKENLAVYTDHFSGFKKKKDQLQQGSESIYDNILEGDGDSAKENIKKILDTEAPAEVIDKHIMPAMNEVGKRYQSKVYFLPQLIASADVVKAILPFIKERLPQKQEGEEEVKILFATVKGDVHDIGKNIVISIIESFNYTVIDLGKDVSTETIIKEAIKHKAKVIGLSTLMTTTMPAMRETVAAISNNEQLKDVMVFVGGAVINKAIADEIDALYSKDGMGMVKIVKESKK
ncbi:MAG: dihydropteroate synthase [bacterium]|nr:dihydropteroate synthase [bacterium]